MKIVNMIKDREPVLTMGLFEAFIGLLAIIAIVCGVDSAAIATVVASLNVFLGAFVSWVIRAQVTPNASVADFLMEGSGSDPPWPTPANGSGLM